MRAMATALALAGSLALASEATATGLYSDPIGNPAAMAEGSNGIQTEATEGTFVCAYKRGARPPDVIRITLRGNRTEWLIDRNSYGGGVVLSDEGAQVIVVAGSTMPLLDTAGLRFTMSEIGGSSPVFLTGGCLKL